MGRYRAHKLDSAPQPEYLWIVIDTETSKVAYLNGTWLEYLTEFEAERLAVELNRLNAERRASTVQ